MKHINKGNFIGTEPLARELVKDLAANGFTVKAVDGAETTQIADTATKFVLFADVAVDTQAVEQPWAIVIEASNVGRFLDVHILPQLQIDETWNPAKRSGNSTVGKLSVGGLDSNRFADMAKWGMSGQADLSVFPLAFDLVITDHGIAFSMNAEGHDNKGTAHSWFVCQRGVTEGETAVGEKSPLFCVFSNAGGQQGNPDDLINDSILRYTVIEKDIKSATVPISAVVPSPDGMPIINSLQQVMLGEGNVAIVLFPQLINTHRYVYFTTLDLLGYTSADVISASSEVDLKPGAKLTTYRGMNANGSDNRGMRILFPIKEA